MNSLSYSSEALDVLTEFHEKPYIVYVEGVDDIPFWNTIFKAFRIKNYLLKPAGGSSELEKYCRSIMADNADIFVARDTDFTEILKTKTNHPRIIWTYGHSIENSLYHPSNLAEVISIFSRSQSYEVAKAENWLLQFAEEFRHLLVFEVVNQKYKLGLEILGDTCGKFVDPKKHHLVSKQTVDKKKTELLHVVDEKKYKRCEKFFNLVASKKPLFFLIRGHFLTMAVNSYIRHEGKNSSQKSPSISNESLYTNLISILKNECISNSTRDDIQYLKKQLAILTQ